MSDKLLDNSQLINGAAVLLSFFLGYKYAMSVVSRSEKSPSKKIEGMSGVFSDYSKDYKMVLVVRNDLKMGKGKIASQCGHAAVGAYQKAIKKIPHVVRMWENSGCAKIALKVESEKELMEIKRAAEHRDFLTCLIRDAGRTQIEPNSKTVLAIGPAVVNQLDSVTGHLKLL